MSETSVSNNSILQKNENVKKKDVINEKNDDKRWCALLKTDSIGNQLSEKQAKYFDEYLKEIGI